MTTPFGGNSDNRSSGNRSTDNRSAAIGTGLLAAETARCALALGIVSLLTAFAPAADASRLGLFEARTASLDLSAADGTRLELFLDSESLRLEDHPVGANLVGSALSNVSVTRPSIGPIPDLVGAPVIDDAARRVHNDAPMIFGVGGDLTPDSSNT